MSKGNKTPVDARKASSGEKKLAKSEEDGSGISSPYDIQKTVSMGIDLNWSADSPEDIFTVQGQLGRGAYGTVFKAVFKSSGFPLAVKRVVEEKNIQSTIQKEVDILRKLNHPYIVNYFGCLFGNQSLKKEKAPTKAVTLDKFQYPDEDKALWILMDFCSGGSIRDHLDGKGTLNENQLAAVLIGVLQGLVYLHSQKIIHRDLKAANILINDDGKVKIADFGISTQLTATVANNPKTMIGTTYWMAPEILTEHYDSKIDIWSLGITAIEMMERDPPNFNLKPFQLMLKLPTAPPPTFKNPTKVSALLKEFVASCLQKDVTKRPDAKQLLSSPFIDHHLKTVGAKGLSDIIIEMAKAKTPNSPVTK